MTGLDIVQDIDEFATACEASQWYHALESCNDCKTKLAEIIDESLARKKQSVLDQILQEVLRLKDRLNPKPDSQMEVFVNLGYEKAIDQVLEIIRKARKSP